MKQEQLILESWQKGLISRISSDMIPNDAMSECVNVDLSNKYIPQSIKGHQKYNPTEIATAPVKGGIVYNNSEDGEIIVVACGGFLWYAKLGTTTFTKYQIGGVDLTFDATVNVEMVQYNDKLYITNGKYPVISNTGYSTSCILVVNKYTPYVLNRTNYYAWSYSGTTYYTTSATPSNGDAIYSDTIGTATEVTVSTFTGGDTYFVGSDTHQYDRLATADKDNSVTPQGLRYLFIHQERLFGLSTIEDPNGIYWSLPYDPTSWTPIYGLNYDTVGKDDGEVITGGASFNEIFLYVFKKHNVYRYMTSGDIDQWASNKVDTDYGCVSHRTIKLFEGNLVYLSDNGVVKLNGNQAVLIDDAIRDKTTNVALGSGVTVERSYTKEQYWDYAGSSRSGIIVADNTISAIKDFNINEFLDNSDEVGQYLFCDNTNVRCDMRIQFESTTTPTGDTLAAANYNIGGSELLHSNFIFKISQIRNFPLQNVQLYITSKSITQGKNARIYLQVLDNYNGSVLHTSSSINYGDITTSAWNNFTFTSVNLTGNTTYWIRVVGYCEEQLSGYGYSMSVRCNTYTNSGDGYRLETNGSYTLNNVSPGLKYNTTLDLDDYTYISKEINTLCTDHFNLQNLIKTTLAGQTYTTYTVKISVANYPTTAADWDSIDTDYITEYTLTESSSDTIAISDTTAEQFLRYKIEFTTGYYGVSNLFFKVADAYDYVSEPLRITSTNPNGWLLSTFGRTGTTDAGNLAKIYMRCAVNAGALASATYYELLYDTLINTSMPFYQYVQFKVAFPSNSDNVVDTITVNFLTTETIVTPCAEVWKTKYILNMPENNTVSTNSIEYIYDKDGYWITKDAEANFIYFRSANNLFAGDIATGTIRYKDVGYTNDGTAYTCYFVTKKFALTDFENLFRKLKFRYQSLGVPIKLSYSVDGLDYVDITIPVSTGLIETLHSLTGIVRGQTIQFKFSWDSDASAEIHKLVLLWSPLRELNI